MLFSTSTNPKLINLSMTVNAIKVVAISSLGPGVYVDGMEKVWSLFPTSNHSGVMTLHHLRSHLWSSPVAGYSVTSIVCWLNKKT